jgi:hypothetical protein
MKDSNDPDDEDNNLLLRYIITACFRKMIHRFTNKSLSVPYFDSLISVNVEEIVFHESEPNLSESDKTFFLKLLPLARTDIHTETGNIRERVRLIVEAETEHSAKPALHLDEQHEYIPLYTKETYKEFHLLFIELLRMLKANLTGLGKQNLPEPFQVDVQVVAFVGNMLRLLAKGNVLKIHLKTIESSLEEHRRVGTSAASIPKLNECNIRGEDVPDRSVEASAASIHENEPDEDLEAVQPQARDNFDSTQQLPLHQSYSEWLKLMLVYFDATEVLKGYVTGSRFPFKTIDIAIMVSPRTSNTLLRWQEVFTPEILSIVTQDEHHSNSDTLLAYFQKAASSNFYESFSLLIQAKNSIASKKNRIVTRTLLTKLSTSSTVPGWKEWAEEQLVKLSDLKEDENLDLIHEAIQSVLDGNQFKFFKFLHDIEKSPLEFGGMMHCEVSLVSLLVHSKVGKIDGYEDIRTQLEVG